MTPFDKLQEQMDDSWMDKVLNTLDELEGEGGPGEVQPVAPEAEQKQASHREADAGQAQPDQSTHDTT